MNIGEALDKLTVNQSVITDYYEQEYSHAEFKVKSSDVFESELHKYFTEDIFAGKSLGWIKMYGIFGMIIILI